MNSKEFERASKIMADLNDAKECLDILSVWEKRSGCRLQLRNVEVALFEDNVPSLITMPKELTPIVLNILRERTEKRLKKLQDKFEEL